LAKGELASDGDTEIFCVFGPVNCMVVYL